jgi:hypothetical protein
VQRSRWRKTSFRKMEFELMQNHTSRTPRARFSDVLRSVAGLALLAGAGPLLAVPVVSGVSGALDHKAAITISGSGFGTKATAAPLVWDDATGSNLLSTWDGAWPNLVPGYNTSYFDPIRGIAPPHSHDSRYIAGAHATNQGAYSGYDVMVFKNITLQPFPFYIYASWYQRADNDWKFGGDNNFKTFDYSAANEPYAQSNWYVCYGPPHPGSTSDSATQWAINDDGKSLMIPTDAAGSSNWWGMAVDPMGGKWSKVETAIKVTDQLDGYVMVWENGHKVMNYQGPTDRYSGDRRSIAIGGYARVEVPSNWRYYADAYIDTSLQRVVLANKPVLTQATIIENQIPSTWSDGSISATVNLGQFNQGETAYLFVVDATGTPSAKGLAVTAGGPAAPRPPSAVVVRP